MCDKKRRNCMVSTGNFLDFALFTTINRIFLLEACVSSTDIVTLDVYSKIMNETKILPPNWSITKNTLTENRTNDIYSASDDFEIEFNSCRTVVSWTAHIKNFELNLLECTNLFAENSSEIGLLVQGFSLFRIGFRAFVCIPKIWTVSFWPMCLVYEVIFIDWE